MAEMKRESAGDNVMRLVVNLGGLAVFVGLIVLVVATIVEEAS
jgi:hypothetical protein